MASWAEFTKQSPELAAFGKTRFSSGVAYLATLRLDGGPRVHPVTPILGEELFLFMELASPKGKDLLQDPRYQLYCAVEDMSGGKGEFYVRGRAEKVEDTVIRQQAVRAAPYSPQERYILFRLSVEYAFMNTYVDGKPHPLRWEADK